VEPIVIGGVKVYVVTPESIPETNRNRLLVHVHGGGYVFGPGEAGTREAILMAGYSDVPKIAIFFGLVVLTTSFHTAMASSSAAGYGKSGGMR
jgi:hypothetical protein